MSDKSQLNSEVTVNVIVVGGVKRKGWFWFFTLNSTKNYIVCQLIFTSHK